MHLKRNCATIAAIRLFLLAVITLTALLPFAPSRLAQSSMPASAPAAQQTYAKLSADGSELKEQFNLDRGHTRLLLLVSPT
jgi:hypothetical protein